MPEDLPPDELTGEKVAELLARPVRRPRARHRPGVRATVVVKAGRYGPYVTTVVPEGSKEAPADGEPVRLHAPETVTLDEALKLLTLPRVVGAGAGRRGDPGARTAATGPTSRRAPTRRSLRQRGRSCSPSPSTRRWRSSPSPSSGAGPRPRPRRSRSWAPTRSPQGAGDVREGRFGPYVTDGETNASLRKGDDVETITIERAAELLADRRAGGRRRQAAKKTTAKKAREEGDGEEDDRGQEDAAKKTAAKKAAVRGPTSPADHRRQLSAGPGGGLAARGAPRSARWPPTTRPAAAGLPGRCGARSCWGTPAAPGARPRAGTGLLTERPAGGRPRGRRGRPSAPMLAQLQRPAAGGPPRSERAGGGSCPSRTPTSTRSSPARRPTGSSRPGRRGDAPGAAAGRRRRLGLEHPRRAGALGARPWARCWPGRPATTRPTRASSPTSPRALPADVERTDCRTSRRSRPSRSSAASPPAATSPPWTTPRARTFLGRVRRLLATHPDTRGRDRLELPYVTSRPTGSLPADARPAADGEHPAEGQHGRAVRARAGRPSRSAAAYSAVRSAASSSSRRGEHRPQHGAADPAEHRVRAREHVQVGGLPDVGGQPGRRSSTSR